MVANDRRGEREMLSFVIGQLLNNAQRQEWSASQSVRDGLELEIDRSIVNILLPQDMLERGVSRIDSNLAIHLGDVRRVNIFKRAPFHDNRR